MAMVGEGDPAAPYRAGAIDVRPWGRPEGRSGTVLASGASDLHELRSSLETVTGAGTWPFEYREPAATELRLTARTVVDRSAMLRFLARLEDEVTDRTGAWRTWRTVIETVATAWPDRAELTVDAIVSGQLSDEIVHRRDR